MARLSMFVSCASLAALLLIGSLLAECDQAIASSLPNDREQDREIGLRLDRELERTWECRSARADVLELHRAGLVDFDEVVATFRALGEQQPQVMKAIENAHAGKTEKQYVGFQILASATGLELSADERNEFIRELIRALDKRLEGDVLIPPSVAHLLTGQPG